MDIITEELKIMSNIPLSDRILKIVVDHLGLKFSDVTLFSNISYDLKGDSLDFAEIVAQIEQEFSIDIPDNDLEEAKTIMDFCQIVLYYLLDKEISNLPSTHPLTNLFANISSLELMTYVSQLQDIKTEIIDPNIIQIIDQVLLLNSSKEKY